MKQIGYAAAETSGYKTSGELSREDVAALTRGYLEYMGQALIAVGLPLSKLYHHAGGVPNIPYNASFTSAVKAGAALPPLMPPPTRVAPTSAETEATPP